MINYGCQYIDNEDIKNVVKVLKSKTITQGTVIGGFENKLKKKFKSKYCIVVNSGTAALHLAGTALGWKDKDIVLTSPNTFIASSNAIIYSNATPDFIDIDKKSFNIDINYLEDKIKKYRKINKGIKSVIATDFAGHPCDWENLKYLKNKYNFTLVNDNCHSLGSKFKNNIGYAVKYADIVTQSYHPVKAITTGEGGSILTNSKKYSSIIYNLRNHGITKTKKMQENKGLWYYQIRNVGFNYRISDINCALGSSQLDKLNLFVEKRNKISKIYNEYLKDIDFFKLPEIDTRVYHSYHLLIGQYDFKKRNLSKKNFFKYMKKNKVNLQLHYIPIYKQPYYKKNFNFKLEDYKNTEDYYQRSFTLPNFYKLNEKNIKYIAKKVKNFFK